MFRKFIKISLILFLLLILFNIMVLAYDNFIEEYQLNNLYGYKLLKDEQYEEAIEFFLKSTKLNPDYAVAYNNLGSSYYRLKKYEQAIDEFKKAIDLEKNYTKAYINLASCYFWKGKYFSAYRYYLKGKKIDEDYVEKRLDLEEAKAKVEEKMKNNPDDKKLKEIYNKLLEYENNNN
ncbi:tetratricopeptide repeat protein [Orenia marismortui]|uniref:tetratricopeptide repeat protein n=1 Tax=Orenia marismortui TaxID=46469 RepID=UPI000381A6A7|nr:tetratricopeptide repeat protein [Orenia marismortui]